jgi:glycosyltransferase involved in cell wall biosynthesis
MNKRTWSLDRIVKHNKCMFFIDNPFGPSIYDPLILMQSDCKMFTGYRPTSSLDRKLTLNDDPKFLGVNLYGYIYAEFGLGEDARRLYEMLIALGVPVDVYSTAPSPFTTERQGEIPHKSWSESSRYAVNICCMSVFELFKLYDDKSERFDGFYNIAYSPWELSSFSENFSFLDYIIDEYWAPTRFVQKSYGSTLKIPSKKMPYIVEVDKSIKRHIRKINFRFLTVADLNSSEARKNVFGNIECFQLAFQSNEKVELYVKVMGRITEEQSLRLNRITCADNRIFVINESLERSALLELIASSDALLSLHRSEGFGRLPLEAMNLSTAVIATNYSGVTDYLRWFNSFRVKYNLVTVKSGEYPYSPDGAVWADPCMNSAVAQVKSAYTNAPLRKLRVLIARVYTVKKYKVNGLKKLYAKALNEIFHDLEVSSK